MPPNDHPVASPHEALDPPTVARLFDDLSSYELMSDWKALRTGKRTDNRRAKAERRLLQRRIVEALATKEVVQALLGDVATGERASLRLVIDQGLYRSVRRSRSIPDALKRQIQRDETDAVEANKSVVGLLGEALQQRAHPELVPAGPLDDQIGDQEFDNLVRRALLGSPVDDLQPLRFAVAMTGASALQYRMLVGQTLMQLQPLQIAMTSATPTLTEHISVMLHSLEDITPRLPEISPGVFRP